MKPSTANVSLRDVGGEWALDHAVAGTLDLNFGMFRDDTNLGCWYRV